MVKRLFLVCSLITLALLVGCGKKGPSYSESVQVYKTEKDLLADAENELEESKAEFTKIHQLYFKMKYTPPDPHPLTQEQLDKLGLAVEKSKEAISILESKVENHREKVQRAKEVMDEAEKNR